MRIPLALRCVSILLAASCAAFAQDEPVVTHEVAKGAVYWIEGGSGLNANSGVIIGTTGVIVVNAKINPASAQRVIAEVAKLTAKPITHVILTHSDGQNGLTGFPDGLTIIAHETARRKWSKPAGAAHSRQIASPIR